ncbi:hypothetical protein [Paenirhodobacter populi]|uniref:hypothetical protein n=1 Tax=Paenirhodobacter populi TaxID=2306993 RepID=UPI000FE35E4F|nr:hypothetical protein [Sinirhodobacter populi]RWR04020.1 hypothetical protein D2T32_21000 [Sinirhodobacter populi]
MSYVTVIAGITAPTFDALQKESDKLLAPNGNLIALRSSWQGYSKDYIESLIERAYQVAKTKSEGDPFQTLLLYVDYGDETTTLLKESFFPFSLPFPIQPPPMLQGQSRPLLNREVNSYIDNLVKESRRIRNVAKTVTRFTGVANLTPLLLPPVNFRGNELMTLLRSLYDNLHSCKNVDNLILEEIKKFKAISPLVRPPESNQSCYSDGRLFFKSPGKDRHGFFRNSAADLHAKKCLLNARSRIGGSYPHSFHYDCMPVRGALDKSYPNCHGDNGKPKERHVNISPSDYII